MSDITGGCRSNLRVWQSRESGMKIATGACPKSQKQRMSQVTADTMQILRISFTYVGTWRSEAHIASFHTPSHDSIIVNGHLLAMNNVTYTKPRNFKYTGH